MNCDFIFDFVIAGAKQAGEEMDWNYLVLHCPRSNLFSSIETCTSIHRGIIFC
jgi:hypothetical protein